MIDRRQLGGARGRQVWAGLAVCIGCAAPVAPEVRGDADSTDGDPMPFSPFYLLPHAPPGFVAEEAPLPPPRPPLVLNHGRRELPKVALTFDACSSARRPGYDDRVAEILVATGTKATIFMGGRWALAAPDAALHLAQTAGIEIANHGFEHKNLVGATEAEIRAEIAAAQDAIYSVTGVVPRLFRPPFALYDRRVAEVTGALGLVVVQYDVASGDPDQSFTPEVLTRWVVDSVQGGAIILMHINRRGWYTADALPAIIGELAARGFAFVTVSELLADLDAASAGPSTCDEAEVDSAASQSLYSARP
ncbi:MAG: polysaccharide deacetylase family protein [Deltaproteobacteria bacterium]|nr:polysaccharide deacetylase family protein [Deltaproteobacteria bacterium]